MKSFGQFLAETKNPIPVGKYDSDKRMNIDHFVRKIESSKPRVVTFNPTTMISIDMLFATQHEINDRMGFDDPVFPDYDDKPVLITIYIDGHNGLTKQINEVYMFDYWNLTNSLNKYL